MKPSVSIIMPALNEEECLPGSIEGTLKALDATKTVGELIVVNDGSTDQTMSHIQQWMKSDSRVSVVVHDHPEGIGRSFWDGFSKARNDVVVMYPGDGEMLPAEMLNYLELFDQVDVVVPFIVNGVVRSAVRRFLSDGYAWLMNSGLGLKVRHTNGLVMYRRSILEGVRLRNNGFLYQAELLLKTVGRGYLFAEVPYFIRPRMAGQSKASLFKTVLQLRYLWDEARLEKNRKKQIVADSATYRRLHALGLTPERKSNQEVTK
jgi:dolichol-phosphate mannosyltransferase